MDNWTDARLDRLFARYNRRYWCGRLPRYAVRVHKLDVLGRCDRKKREILIDVAQHKSDWHVRDTLLHEMAHAASNGGHGYEFWAQVEALLRQGAPVTCGFSETDGLLILAGVIPRKFPLARKAMERVEAARARTIERGIQQTKCPVHQVTDDEIVERFREAALCMTERFAVPTVGEEYGLIDVGLRPTSKWAARVIVKGRKAFRISRRDHLAWRKRCEATAGSRLATA